MTVVSVIIPCYNAAGYIERCLASMEAQTFRNFEVILVDDCSSDNTIEVIRQVQKNMTIPVTLLENSQNAGPGISRNRGIQQALSEYVCFCDCDDWYDPDFLELMVNASQDMKADMVFCNARKILSNNTIDIILFRNMPQQVSPKEALALGIDSLCCLMVRQSIAASVAQPALRNGEDMAVIPLMIMRSHQFGFIEKSIYNYLCRSGSLSLTCNAGVMLALESSFEHIISHQVSGFEQEIEYIGIKNLLYGGLLNYFKGEKKFSTARQWIRKFEDRYPQWYANPYRNRLPIFKKVFLFFARAQWCLPLYLMCKVHKLLTERG